MMMMSYLQEDLITTQSYEVGIELDNGESVHFGPCETKEELLTEVKPYCEEQVKAGNMTQEEADDILNYYQ